MYRLIINLVGLFKSYFLCVFSLEYNLFAIQLNLKRMSKMTKTGGTTRANLISVPEKLVYYELDFAQSSSSFSLEHCYQKTFKGNNSLSESPYCNSEEGVNTLREKQARQKEENYIYQNA